MERREGAAAVNSSNRKHSTAEAAEPDRGCWRGEGRGNPGRRNFQLLLPLNGDVDGRYCWHSGGGSALRLRGRRGPGLAARREGGQSSAKQQAAVRQRGPWMKANRPRAGSEGQRRARGATWLKPVGCTACENCECTQLSEFVKLAHAARLPNLDALNRYNARYKRQEPHPTTRTLQATPSSELLGEPVGGGGESRAARPAGERAQPGGRWSERSMR